jgi:uncharacterized protein YggT (Ycf19 family)
MIFPLITYYLCELGFVVLNWVEAFLNIFDNTLFTIRSSDPAIINLLNYLKDGFVIYLQAFNTMFTLRFVLMWFPTLNPFIQPYYIVRVITEPPIEWVRKRIPPLLGMDFSFLICSYAISYGIKYLTLFKF